MKLLNTLKYIAVLALGALLVPVATFAYGIPQFSLAGVQNIARTSATVYVSYNGTSADIDVNHRPIITVNYTDLSTGVTSQSSYNSGWKDTQVYEHVLVNLTPGNTYSYRAVMIFNGMTYTSNDQTFTTRASVQATSPQTTQTTQSSDAVWEAPSLNWLFGNDTDTTTSQSSSHTTSSHSSSLVSKIESKIITGGAVHKNNVGLSITNEQAKVSRMDSFTYTIKYENLNTTSLKNAKIVVELPEQYEFVKSSVDADYNRQDNTVTFIIGRVAAETLGGISFKARAIGDGNREVSTIATMSYTGGTLSTSDRDSYDSGSKSVLGASVFGAGFFPQTLGGWMLIIVVILVLVIIARRYMTKPVPKPEEKKAA